VRSWHAPLARSLTLSSVALGRIKLSGDRRRGEDNWYFLARELQSSTLVLPGVKAIRAGSSTPAHITDLRIADVAVWMRQYPDGRLRNDRDTCPPL
jgi:hypothetical protein